MALLQWKFPLDGPWPDRLAVGSYFLSILGVGTVYSRPIRLSGGYFLYRRSEL